jgi:hypothetical protein
MSDENGFDLPSQGGLPNFQPEDPRSRINVWFVALRMVNPTKLFTISHTPLGTVLYFTPSDASSWYAEGKITRSP